jgi:hypothetical protein
MTNGRQVIIVNSLTPKSVPAGTKNSRLEDFFLAKHTSHKHPHHDEPFSRLAAWFLWTKIPHPQDCQEPLQKGLDEAIIEGF